MTSQVALLNSHGVALASDSAVSLGRKTFNTVNKIFPLGSENKETEHHVAFMVSDSGRYIPGGILWERVFDSFSKTQPKTHPTLEKYVEELISFLGRREMFDEQQNNLGVQRDLMEWFGNHPAISGLDEMQSALQSFRWGYATESSSNDKMVDLTPEMLEAIAEQRDERLDKLHDEYMLEKDEKLASNYDEFAPKEVRIRKQNHHNSEEAAKLLVNRHGLSPRFVDVLTDIFNAQLAFSPEPEWRFSSRIVAVGFGHEELAPAMCEMICGAQIDPGDDLIKVKEWFSIRQAQSLEDKGGLVDDHIDGVVHNHGGAIIRGEAYHNEMDNVLNGIHWSDMNHLFRPHRGLPQYLAETILHQIGAALEGVYASGSKKPRSIFNSIDQHTWTMSRQDQEPIDVNIRDYIYQEINEAVWRHGAVRRRQQFRDAVETFPIPELADFAHSLVRMESDICHWMEAHRAVGGPIDVLTITKEQGCVLEPR